MIEQFLELNRFEEPLAQNRRLDEIGAELCFDDAMQTVIASGGAAFVAEVDGRVVGHLFLVLAEDAVCVRTDLRRYAHVAELFVRDALRRTGVGTALMRRAEQFATSCGVSRLTIGVLADNLAAATLYRSLGFTTRAVELEKALPVGPGKSIAEAFAMPGLAEIDVDPPKLAIVVRPADFS